MGRRGFSLMEVMVAVVVLALGTLFIQQGLLRSAHLYGLYVNSFKAKIWLDEKLWEAKEAALYSETPGGGDSGAYTDQGKDFSWSTEVQEIGKNLYSIKSAIEWAESGRPTRLAKEVYGYRQDKTLAP